MGHGVPPFGEGPSRRAAPLLTVCSAHDESGHWLSGCPQSVVGLVTTGSLSRVCPAPALAKPAALEAKSCPAEGPTLVSGGPEDTAPPENTETTLLTFPKVQCPPQGPLG